jgi:RimJ/RimL family protein N-acetyltransferase
MTTVLSDGVVRLRPWEPDDADAVFRACQDPLIARFVPIPQPYLRHHAVGFIEDARTATETGTAIHLAIADAQTGGMLGAISRHPLRDRHATFGYWLAPEARGRGVATRALRLITDMTLATTDVIRLQLYTNLDNDRSGRVAERAGFEREGIRRAWDLDREGHPIDVVFYVKVRQ